MDVGEVSGICAKMEKFLGSMEPPTIDNFESTLSVLEENLGPDNYIIVKLKEKFVKGQPGVLCDMPLEELTMRRDCADDVIRVKGQLETSGGQVKWLNVMRDRREACNEELCRRNTNDLV